MNNYWPSKSNPSFHGVVDSSLTTTNIDHDFNDNIQYHEDIHDVDISNDDLKEYEKKKKTGVGDVCLCNFCFCQLSCV